MTALETIEYRAPLAFQFVDSVGGTAVGDGLVVTAWPAGDPGAARTAAQSPVSTIMGFGRLPGLAGYEEAVTEDPAAFGWTAPGPGRPFEVRVVDPNGRFVPEVLAVSVPRASLASAPLFSAVTRPAPSGFATVLGEVWTAAPSAPAAWAMVQIETAGATYTTMADQVGRYVVYLPYPEALPPLIGSPPIGGAPLDQLTWPLTVWVRYQPSVQARLADTAATDPPELSSLLAQGSATISTSGGSQPGIPATLTFGTPLLVMLEVMPA